MNTDTIINKPLCGKEITKEEGSFLFSQGADREILMAAQTLNESLNGNKVTYVVNRNINFTNVCKIRCKFCGFYREKEAKDAYTLTIDEILRKIDESPNISEVCIQGAINPDLNVSYYLSLLKSVKTRYPSLHIHGISPQEVHFISETTSWSTEKVIGALMEAGLGSMAGTAAEILVDEIRGRIAPLKIGTSRWIEIIRTAHRRGLKSTATILFGHLERDEEIVEHLDLIRSIQRETGGFTEFIPLPFVPYQTPLRRELSPPNMAPWLSIKKFYAFARVYLFPAFKNIQTSWVKLGADRAIETLEAGVNDFGGTLFEENITRSAGGGFSQYLSEQEIRQRLLRVGKEPLRRDTLYNVV